MSRKLTLHAPAKINLALAVDAPRPGAPDPRHPICSWMVPVSLVDDLTCTVLDTGSISRYAILWADDACHKPEMTWPIRTDLAVRAHLLMQETLGRELPVQVRIDKRIPLGAGLGGGSSDAATTLLALNELFDLQLSTPQLIDLAARIGSDVPFFIAQSPAVAHDFGNRIQYVQSPSDLNAVLVLPDLACSTAEVYARFDSISDDEQRRGVQRGRAEIDALIQERQSPDADRLFNDLLRPALALAPGLESLRTALQEAAQRPVHLTGSGAGMFILCTSDFEARQLAPAIQQAVNVPALPVALAMPGPR